MQTWPGVEINFTKWGGEQHWRYVLDPLGEDEYGRWYGGRAGIPMQRGHEAPIIQSHDSVTLVPATGRWIATWNDPSKTPVAIYVDVTTPPIRDDHSVRAVDLDLAVVRLGDGSVEVLDEDEFAEHQVRYRYPPEIVTQALVTTGELVKQITAGVEPFGVVGDRWLIEFMS
jgi:hypothetical protein